jgi:hypothetical protein
VKQADADFKRRVLAALEREERDEREGKLVKTPPITSHKICAGTRFLRAHVWR